MRESFVLPRSTKFKTKGINPETEEEASATERQERVPGFIQEKLNSLTVMLVGAGGLNGEVAVGLARKGVGCLKIFDHDTVELSNLNRQRFFQEDLYKNKAECLARNLTREAIASSTIIGYPLSFQDALEEGIDVSADIAVCGVDNNEARVEASGYFYKNTPVIFLAVSQDAEHGYVFVQEPGKACFACLFPNSVNDLSQHPCSPAITDILRVVAGVALYAMDSLIMNRKRVWNYKEIFLSGQIPDRTASVGRKEDCPICSPSPANKLGR